jgi:threonine dehydratase
MIDIDPGKVIGAAARLKGVANRTPVFTSRTLDEMVGSQVFMKCENFQRGGAFKFRGAYNAISQLSREEIEAGVITHSSGNHAQGVAIAANLVGGDATVVMPFDAPEVKQLATASYGAKIIHCEAAKRERITDDLIEEHGYTLIHAYDNDDIIAGQGTAAMELFEKVGELDMLLVPVGGGGLISGCALAAAELSPGCAVIGVEPVLADDANRSWRKGEIVTLRQVPETIADGLRPLHIGQRNLKIMRKHVTNMITVEEADILRALRFIWQRMKTVVEPSAAVALAPLLSGQIETSNTRIGVLLSGGNVDIEEAAALLAGKSRN